VSWFRGRGSALLAGVLLGAGAMYAASLYPSLNPFTIAPSSGGPAQAQELVAGGTTPGAFRTINEALAQARDGDVIRVLPGRYAESLELRRSVSLISDVPHGAVLVTPPGEKAWVSVTVWADATSLRGFRIVNDAASGHVGVRVHEGDIDIEDVAFEGPMAVGLDAVGAASRAVVRASRFTGVTGVAVQAGDLASVTLRQNLFRAAPGARGPAITVVSAASLSMDANVFMHYGRSPVTAASGPAVVIDPAYVIAPPAAPRGRAR
jgi:hypothetical protein